MYVLVSEPKRVTNEREGGDILVRGWHEQFAVRAVRGLVAIAESAILADVIATVNMHRGAAPSLFSVAARKLVVHCIHSYGGLRIVGADLE